MSSTYVRAHSRTYSVGLWVQGLFYVGQGINHFWHAGMMVRMMPTHYSHPYGLVIISGVAEILGGVGLLVERTRRVAAWGIIFMLVVYFDVHIFMVMHPERFAGIPVWVLWARIPLQFLLIWWAWIYARRGRPFERASF
jgi:uncharacterized membrane protein